MFNLVLIYFEIEQTGLKARVERLNIVVLKAAIKSRDN